MIATQLKRNSVLLLGMITPNTLISEVVFKGPVIIYTS